MSNDKSLQAIRNVLDSFNRQRKIATARINELPDGDEKSYQFGREHALFSAIIELQLTYEELIS